MLHNVAQVPLARDRDLFRSVNVTGTANVLLAARDCGVAKVVHTSSSAIFGIPERNPVTEDTPGRPLEAYGKAKLEAELLAATPPEAASTSHRPPRTILGHGRLGIMAVLFEFVAEGAPCTCWAGVTTGTSSSMPTTSRTLASGPQTARSPPLYNIGAGSSGPWETLQALSSTPARGRGRSCRPAPPAAMRVAEGGRRPVRALPLAALRRVAVVRHHQGPDGARLGAPVLQRVGRDRVVRLVPGPPRRTGGGRRSHHQSPVKLGLLEVLKRLP